jgi:predicted nucleotidyltransferase
MKIQLESLLAGLRHPSIVGAWLFGSARDGEVRPGGDLDVGILFDGKPGLDVLAECRARLQMATGFEEVDLVPLNAASPLVRFEALCGRRLTCADENRCAEFASLTAREYEDEMALCLRWAGGSATNASPGQLRDSTTDERQVAPQDSHRTSTEG